MNLAHLFCLFGVFRPARVCATHMEKSPLPVKEFWPILGFHGHYAVKIFLDCHTYCDMVYPFIMVISKYLWHTLMPNVWQWSCHYLCKRPRSAAAWIQTPNLPHAWRTLPLVLEKEMLKYCQFNYLYFFAFISLLQTSMVPHFFKLNGCARKKMYEDALKSTFLNLAIIILHVLSGITQ